jgi:hypothetical protein
MQAFFAKNRPLRYARRGGSEDAILFEKFERRRIGFGQRRPPGRHAFVVAAVLVALEFVLVDPA